MHEPRLAKNEHEVLLSPVLSQLSLTGEWIGSCERASDRAVGRPYTVMIPYLLDALAVHGIRSKVVVLAEELAS